MTFSLLAKLKEELSWAQKDKIASEIALQRASDLIANSQKNLDEKIQELTNVYNAKILHLKEENARAITYAESEIVEHKQTIINCDDVINQYKIALVKLEEDERKYDCGQQ